MLGVRILLILMVSTRLGSTWAQQKQHEEYTEQSAEDTSELPTEQSAEDTSELPTEMTTVQSEQQSEERLRLSHIYSLAEHCSSQGQMIYCSGFYYSDLSEVAFFELPMHVTIASHGSSYVVGKEHSLTFRDSTFLNFPLHLFYNLDIRALVMDYCSIQFISWEALLMATTLQVLSLADNQLEQLNESTFYFASELQLLLLNRNRLSVLHQLSFRGLHNLRILDLSGNLLDELPPQLFVDLDTLVQLNLADNRLHVIQSNTFVHNPLVIISLHANRLHTLGEYAFSTKLTANGSVVQRLRQVVLSQNQQLKELVLNLSADNLWAQNCSLERVNLYGTLKQVDLSNNRLLELYFSRSELLEKLVLRNNTLVQLALLSRVPRLKYFSVADNPALGELPTDWHMPALSWLDISNTGQQRLPLEALKGMPQLRTLNIARNNISEIPPQAFEQLATLVNISMHGNNWNCFNLNLVMDLLLKPHGIHYSSDDFDVDFPGQYINGVACMYRQPESEQAEQASENVASEQQFIAKEQLQMQLDKHTEQEIVQLRQALKVIEQFFEAKFDRVFEQLYQLKAQLQAIERWNSTLWNQVTIMT